MKKKKTKKRDQSKVINGFEYIYCLVINKLNAMDLRYWELQRVTVDFMIVSKLLHVFY